MVEKEKEKENLEDDLMKLQKHREGQKKQLQAIREMLSIQKKLGCAKAQQREHALSHFQKQRESQSLKLKEKEAQIKDYEAMLVDLKSRDKTLNQHLAKNAPVLESYQEKEDLLRKQVELLKTREKMAKEGLRNAESRTLRSVFMQSEETPLSKLRASNAVKAELQSNQESFEEQH